MITADIELLEVFYAYTISSIAIAVCTSLFMVIFIGQYSILAGLLALAAYVVIGCIIPLWNGRRGGNQGMVFRALTDLAILAFSFGMLYLSLFLYTEGNIQPEGVLICTLAMMGSFGPMVALSSLSNNLNQTLASGERVLSLLEEETHLFHDSIANNIAIDKPGAGREEIMEAAKKASIHEFIMSLPNGYDTEVGELGETLSGGERQQTDLARVFLHDAPFLLLDEPTSNLDSLNEGIILRSLKECQEKKTIVLVSHRRSTMNVADRIYEMDH